MSAGESLLVVGSNRWRVGILPLIGGSLAFGQIADDEGWVDFLRPTAAEQRNSPSACASFVMTPWSNRVRDGILRYEGKSWQLRKNGGLTTAIHGTARDFAWKVLSYDSASCDLEFDSSTVVGTNFPWAFLARVRYEVDGSTFKVRTMLKNYDTEPFPAGFGHHPYFERTLAGASDEVRLQIPCNKAFRLQHLLPEGPAVAIPERIDFRKSRTLGSDLIDDCLTGRDADAPVRMIYPRSHREIHLNADPLFANFVLYAPTGESVFALEPATNANDGFTLYERNVPGSGVFVLEPGEERTAEFSLEIVA